ncbi:decapping and exoribonuclease protein [Nematostella vectensis]|uniref:decapping and exoribonuclease protein n=1 Tax=Nematostella vectensis TaxID=45351 RepID=UPI00207727FB|nr:decapping and exoribonuclease protein [Nematostella vectensis]
MKRRYENDPKEHDDTKRERREEAAETEPDKTLAVTPIDSYRSSFPYFRKPSEIGHFSLDVDRKFHDDSHQLKYFCPPHEIHFDLSEGYKEFKARDEDVKEGLGHLLEWISAHREKFALPGEERVENGQAADARPATKSLNTNFVTWRGHLTKLLCTPYETKEPWQMAATLFKGTIYLSEVETQEAYDRRKNMEERHKEMCYWGHKFETYVTKLVSERGKRETVMGASTSTASTSEGGASAKPVNNSEAYVSVFRSRLERHSLVFGAEIDCCTKETEESPGNYIELKTSHAPHNHQQHWSFNRYKLLKWWAQSYLAGVPKIIAGFRHHHSHVDKLQTYNTLEIPHLLENQQNMWDSTICFNFLEKFLRWLRSVVVLDDPNRVYLFSFRAPFEQVKYQEFTNGEHKFLPEWYIKTF